MLYALESMGRDPKAGYTESFAGWFKGDDFPKAIKEIMGSWGWQWQQAEVI